MVATANAQACPARRWDFDAVGLRNTQSEQPASTKERAVLGIIDGRPLNTCFRAPTLNAQLASPKQPKSMAAQLAPCEIPLRAFTFFNCRPAILKKRADFRGVQRNLFPSGILTFLPLWPLKIANLKSQI